MAGLMSRTMMIIKAKFSALLNRAENPSETLDYSYEKQLESLQNVKRGIADVTTAKKRLELQYTGMQQQVEKLDGQARQALEAGREDLAREALTRKAAVQSQLDGIMQQEVIKAQYSAAEAQVRIGEAATGIGREMEDTGLAIQRAKDKTDQMQARAAALDELVSSGQLEDLTSDQTQLDRELSQLSSQSQVDQELAKLKAEVGSGAGSEKKEIEQ